MTPCDVVEHKEWVTFAMDNTSGAPTARLLNPANIGTNLLNSQFCNGTALNLNDYAIWKESTQTTPFKKVTDDVLKSSEADQIRPTTALRKKFPSPFIKHFF